MKIDGLTKWNPAEPVEEKPSKPAELQQKPLPKTDSVEIKEGSSVILDNIASAPKVDPSQVNLGKGNEMSAALIPGVPFREKVELPKTLPNGTSVDSGVGSSDLGLGKTRPGPNHMGIDLKGNEIRNQLNDALNLKEGSATAIPVAPSGGTVNLTGLAGKPGTSAGDSTVAGSHKPQSTYHAGFERPGMGLISQERQNTPASDLQGLVPQAGVFNKEKKPDAGTGMTEAERQAKERGPSASEEAAEKWRKKTAPDGGTKEYVDPDAPGAQSSITPEQLQKIGVRLGANTKPGVEEYLQGIDASKLSESDPRRKLISNPNPEDQTPVTSGDPQVVLDAKGPDTVNPRDTELGGGNTPIVIDPDRPK